MDRLLALSMLLLSCLVPAHIGYKYKETLSVEPKVVYGPGQFLQPGSQLKISCKASGWNQKVEWEDPKGGIVRRTGDSRVRMQQQPAARTAVLVVSALAVEDTGVWQCRASPGGLRHPVPLCVIDPSSFLEADTEVTVDHGRSASLRCRLLHAGRPEPNVRWLRDGDAITDDTDPSKYRVTLKYSGRGLETVLTVVSAERTDHGLYVCEAQQQSQLLDDCGHRQTLNFTLNVNYPPVLEGDDDVKLVYGSIGQNVELVCTASGLPLPTIRWYREDGDTIIQLPLGQTREHSDEEDGMALVAVDVTVDATTFGRRYLCRVNNTLGSSEKLFVILKFEKPRKPTEVMINNSTNEGIQLNVTWDDQTMFPVDGVQVQYLALRSLQKIGCVPREVDWKEGSWFDTQIDEKNVREGLLVSLTSLEEDTKYWIRLRAWNEAGASPWSEPVLACTEGELKQEEIFGSSQNVPPVPPARSRATVYALLIIGAILVVILICMSLLKYA